MHFFVRVNGNTAHNNPNHLDCYVMNEPPVYPQTYFNYLSYCFENDIVRIGWPAIGDLRDLETYSNSTCYSFQNVKPHIQSYLLNFRNLPVDSLMLIPDKDKPGDVYICRVIGPYEYFYHTPEHPFECAHRRKVVWDRDSNGEPILYNAIDFGIKIRGGFWLRAFQDLSKVINYDEIVMNIKRLRSSQGL